MDNKENLSISPVHYSVWKIQPLDFIRKNNIDFCRGNVIKYILRHEDKNGIEDLKKSYVYLMQHVYYVYGIEGINEISNTNWNVTSVK